MVPLTPQDLVLDKSNGNTTALGMNINSYLCKNNESAAYIIKNDDNSSESLMKGGGPAVANISDMFRGLAVPAGLLYLQQNTGKKYPSASKNEDLLETTYLSKYLYLITLCGVCLLTVLAIILYNLNSGYLSSPLFL